MCKISVLELAQAFSLSPCHVLQYLVHVFFFLAYGILASFIYVEHRDDNRIKWPKTPRTRVKYKDMET